MVTVLPKFPVFIVGSPRSGTSVLVDALMSAGYHGYREGLFLSLIQPMSKVIDRQFTILDAGLEEVLISNIDKLAFKDAVWEVVKNAVERVNKPIPWFDKTGEPEMIYSIPVIRSLWPESIFLFAKRRGLENIMSRLVKFPAHGFKYHCQNWQDNMAAWRAIRGSIPQDSFLEVDQHDLGVNPQAVASALSNFLTGSDALHVAIQKTLVHNRPQQTSEGTAHRVVSLASCGWNEAQQALFQQICAPEMEAFGYTTDFDYSVAQMPAAPSQVRAG
jgi:Sulfotransferase family